MKTVLITGGSGLVGKALTNHLVQKGYNIIVLTRGKSQVKEVSREVTYTHWDIVKQTIDIDAVQQADYIIHLAGAGVMDKSWTDSYKREIVASRVESARLIVRTLQKNSNKVQAVVSASAIGWYGPDKGASKKFIETDPADKGFLGETCRLWEESIEPVKQLGKRLVKFRSGIVLSNDGGALPEFKKPLRVGVAGILGSGRQMLSWVHIEDLCRLYTDAIEHENLNGVYNAVAPNPVTNKELILDLAHHLKGKFFIPMHVPDLVLKTMLGARSIEVLKSATVSSEKIKETGFTFLYPSIEAALQQLCNSK